MESNNDRLLRNLVDSPDSVHSEAGKVSFIDAMQELGIESVFDIIRQSKTQFVERLGEICEADGSLAYDNAMCYAGQIASLFREHQVSSGRSQHQSQRSGVRALVDVGPGYPNLFKENWDQFCKVGALAALDSPVAYLNSLFHFATRTLETSGQGTQPKIRLNTRRPDIASLVIDQHSTFTPRPMLELVNDVLKNDIQKYLQGKPDQNKPIYEVLAERRHPFLFPYNFAHHQCQLGLTAKKLELGVMNYRASMALPLTQEVFSQFGSVNYSPLESQKLLTGLSPQQQQLLIEPSLFSTFYLSKTELSAGKHWRGPGTSHLRPHSALSSGFVLPLIQLTVLNVQPYADKLIVGSSGINLATLMFSAAGQSPVSLGAVELGSTTPRSASIWRFNHAHTASSNVIGPSIRWRPTVPFPSQPGYRTSFTVTTTAGPVASPTQLATLSFTLILDDTVTWTDAQEAFFQKSYGLHSEALIDLKHFMQQTELNAEQVEALLSQRTHAPRLSPNCPSKNPQHLSPNIGAPYPHANHYGACYVNGHGSDRYDSVVPATTASIRKDQFDNSMGLREVKQENRASWYLTKTSANRLDRLQRMIRLQRWFGIPFAELDTLIISAIRSEGEDNLGMDLNTNTLRTLGVYRYLSQRYSVQPEEFAAFLHDLTPYATGDRVSLFDQVFNVDGSALFGAPLVLDQQPFQASGSGMDATSKRTVSQLCAGLGLQPTETSFLHFASRTVAYVGTLKRDLATVSSLYRQARIAQLFGLSAREGMALVDLLGGNISSVCSAQVDCPRRNS
ncbi:Tc toxin subunit A [Pseudomonas sp. S1_E04]